MNGSENIAAISTGLLVGIGFVLLVQLTLQIIAIVLLVKTPSERVSIGGRKWVWALIIILGELVGPILFFILGRKPAAAVEPTSVAPATSRASAAADALYGAPAAAPAAPVAPPATVPAAVPPRADTADDDATTPESLAGDPEIGADGTGSGELP